MSNKQKPPLINPLEYVCEYLGDRLDEMNSHLKGISEFISRFEEDGKLNDRIGSKEALEILRPRFNSIQSLTQACRRGSLPCSKEGRAYVFRKTELIKWIEEGAPDLAKQQAEDEAANYLVNGVRSWEK
jgi:hypothetical protein